jgi:hypothetical protein
MNWLLENDVFGEDLNPLTDELTRQDIRWNFAKYLPFGGDRYNFGLKEDEPTFFYGSLNLAKYLQKVTRFEPGAICNFDNYKCSKYYNYFGKYLLNQDYTFLPIAEAIRRKDEIFEQYARKSSVFVRPDDGSKSFKGKLLNYHDFNLDGFEYGFYHEDETLMTVISSPKEIEAEYRFFVGDHKVLCGSSYKADGRLKNDEEVPSEAKALAEEIASEKWSPDVAWSCDIFKSEDNYYLGEINSFSCSGMYGCDPKPIIEFVEKLTESEIV